VAHQIIKIKSERLERGLLRWLTVDTRGQKLDIALVKGELHLSAEQPFSADVRGPAGETEQILTSEKEQEEAVTA
jgi:hypothetical protein